MRAAAACDARLCSGCCALARCKRPARLARLVKRATTIARRVTIDVKDRACAAWDVGRCRASIAGTGFCFAGQSWFGPRKACTTHPGSGTESSAVNFQINQIGFHPSRSAQFRLSGVYRHLTTYRKAARSSQLEARLHEALQRLNRLPLQDNHASRAAPRRAAASAGGGLPLERAPELQMLLAPEHEPEVLPRAG